MDKLSQDKLTKKHKNKDLRRDNPKEGNLYQPAVGVFLATTLFLLKLLRYSFTFMILLIVAFYW
jgi:hypothetical protein